MSRHNSTHTPQVTRRAFLQNGSLVLAGATAASVLQSQAWGGEAADKPQLRVGLITDIHYADRDPNIGRHYRESLVKLREAVARFNQEKLPVAFELGDFIDAAPEVETEIGFLRTIEEEYAKFQGKRNYVLGNHCVYTLTKEQFVEHTAMPAAHYAFDVGGFHFVILDACYRADGVAYGAKNFTWTDTTIPPDQIDWLKQDLAATNLPTVVLTHQRLDLDKDTPAGKSYAIASSPQVRQVLADSQKVLAVFMGHSHKNFQTEIDGIHYCVLRACVEGPGAENNGYAIANLFADGSIRVEGLREQKSYAWRSVK